MSGQPGRPKKPTPDKPKSDKPEPTKRNLVAVLEPEIYEDFSKACAAVGTNMSRLTRKLVIDWLQLNQEQLLAARREADLAHLKAIEEEAERLRVKLHADEMLLKKSTKQKAGQ
jgi:hypothetical protein